MHAGPADHSPVNIRAMALRFVLRRLAKRSGLQLRMIGELVPLHDLNFVVREIRFGEVGPLLQHHHAKAIGRKLLRQHPSGGSGANNHEIHFFGCLVLGLIHRHVGVVSFAKDNHYIIGVACDCCLRHCRCTMSRKS